MDLFNTVRNAILESVDRKKQTIQREIADLQNKITKAHMGGSGDVKAYQAEINRLRAQLREEPEQVDEINNPTVKAAPRGYGSSSKKPASNDGAWTSKSKDRGGSYEQPKIYASAMKKEEVEEIDENWAKGSSSSYHSDRAKAAEYEKKANSTLNAAKSIGKSVGTDHPRYKKLMGDYHSAMAKHVKHAYHGNYKGGYPSQTSAKKEYNAHIRQAKEYRSEVKEEFEPIAETKKYEFDVSGEYGNKAADRFVNLAKKKGIDAKVHTYNGPGGGNPVVHLAHSDHTVIHKFLKKHYDPHMSHDEIERHRFDEAVKNPYAVGMAAAMKSTGDKPPLKKSTIIKAHDIAKGIEAKEEIDKGLEDELMSQRQGESGKKWRVERMGKTISTHNSKDMADVKAMRHPLNKVRANEEKDSREYDYEGEMASNQLEQMIHHINELKSLLKPTTNLPEWVQSKITLATDYIQTASDYLKGEMKEEMEIDEAGLWDNIHAKRERIKRGSGEHMRKPGSKGAPTAADFKASQNEEVELEEGRGRPPKPGSEAWKRAQTERKKDPAEHIINRMGQAATNMTGGQHITYDDGKIHRVGNNLAARTLAHYRGLKPAEKEVFQKKIAKSHQDHLDALAGK